MHIDFFSSKIEKEIFSQNLKIREHTLHLLKILERFGQDIRMPYSKNINRGIFELRVIGASNIRILYCFHKDKAVVLHVINKKQNKIPKKDLEIAISRKNMLA